MSDTRTYSIMAKPAGSSCNLRCSYCYYKSTDAIMAPHVLDAYIQQTVEAHGTQSHIEFAWHGGEPTLCGVDFFRHAVWVEKKYAPGRKISNTLQTNGTLIDDTWCRFFRENSFLIGISIDGPEDLHDANRTYKDGTGSFLHTMRGLRSLQKWGVPYNTITTINTENVSSPDRVYNFLRRISDHMQFLPVVDGVQQAPGIVPGQFGDFMCSVLDMWRYRDTGRKFIQIFEAAVGNMMNSPAGVCIYEPVCGHAAAVETDGSLYSCDWFSNPAHRLGNILDTPLADLMVKNRPFGMAKADLPQECLSCPHLGLCWGGCPRHRTHQTNTLCEDYKKLFTKIKRTIRIN